MISSVLKPPRAVLFDYDGVLVASEPIHLSAWRQLLIELGLPGDLKAIQSRIGKTAPEILKELLDQYQPGWNPADYNLHELAQRKNVFYLSFAENRLQTYPGVVEGLKGLRARGIPIAVVSNARRRELETTLKQLNLFPLLDEVISRDDVSAFKPDPLPYLTAAAALGVEPTDCVAVEDSPTGLEAALLARIPTAAVLTSFSRAAVEAPVPGRPDLKPTWIGASIQDFFKWLDSLG